MKTKLVATIGPASDSYETVRSLAYEGLDIARVNFSHATFDEYRMRREFVLKAAQETGKPIKILADLQGPRMRIGKIEEGGRVLNEGDVLVFSTSPEHSDAILIDNPYLHEEIQVDEPLFLSSGTIECRVTCVDGNYITAQVIRGGHLFSRKGVNTPFTKLRISGLTDKDITDAEFVLSEGVDYIAISFVQSAADVGRLRDIVGDRAKIISKIETNLALKNIDEIIQASDGIMIGRGDLGIEIAEERVPYVQRHLINHCAWHEKPVIVATQMLISMVDNPVPTRAEVSDVANAVWQRADAVMLSDETASGQYPVKAMKTLRKIVEETENKLYGRSYSL